MTHSNMTGQTAIVTGGGQGIGLAVAAALRSVGAKVTSWDVNTTAMIDLGATSEMLAVSCDITDFAQIQTALATTEHQLGPVTTLLVSQALMRQLPNMIMPLGITSSPSI